MAATELQQVDNIASKVSGAMLDAIVAQKGTPGWQDHAPKQYV
jgi:hypothetical protein